MADKIKTAPNALKEITAIFKWYEKRSKGLGDLFFEELENTFEKILLHPEHYMLVMDDIQRAMLKKFPHVVFFHLKDEIIFVVRVRHKKQKPLKRFK